MSVLPVVIGETKRCSKCKRYKPFAEFYKHKGHREGLQSRCKACMSRAKYRNPEDRFWAFFHAHTVRVGTCLEWTGAYLRTRIPACHWEGRGTTVRRVVYQLALGELADTDVVTTTCGNRKCVRQAHLMKLSAEAFRVRLDNSAPSGDRSGMRLHPERATARLHPERLARGDQHWTRRNPERLARGDRNGMRLHPDRNGARLHPERLARGDQHWTRLHPERLARGERVSSAKLTAADVQAIRQRYAAGGVSTRALADAYGISPATMWDLLHRRTWAHVPDAP